MADVALSIRQPWVWAIIHAGKRIENRSWRTAYRGPILIHASKAKPSEDDVADFRTVLNDACSPSKLDRICRNEIWGDQPRGGIVARAEIIDCVSEHESPWFFGPYGFVLDKVETVSFRPYRGALGFFRVEAA